MRLHRGSRRFLQVHSVTRSQQLISKHHHRRPSSSLHLPTHLWQEPMSSFLPDMLQIRSPIQSQDESRIFQIGRPQGWVGIRSKSSNHQLRHRLPILDQRRPIVYKKTLPPILTDLKGRILTTTPAHIQYQMRQGEFILSMGRKSSLSTEIHVRSVGSDETRNFLQEGYWFQIQRASRYKMKLPGPPNQLQTGDPISKWSRNGIQIQHRYRRGKLEVPGLLKSLSRMERSCNRLPKTAMRLLQQKQQFLHDMHNRRSLHNAKIAHSTRSRHLSGCLESNLSISVGTLQTAHLQQ